MTRKLTLNPESLSVESFESGNAAGAHGTVQGHDVKGALPDLGGRTILVPAHVGLPR